jgi:predicted nucleic acid-binding protein
LNFVDAGVIVELVAGGLDPARLGVEDLAAPHLLDSQVMHVLRGLVLRGALTQEQAVVAMGGFAELAIARYPADWLRPRMWALRRNLSAYDATYVALAEMTAATSLLTTDARLAHAPGVRCTVQVL